jgi:DNA uptake protein ComE-like DNA-binding protein
MATMETRLFLSLAGERYIARLYFVDCAETDNQVPDRIVQQMEAFGVSEDTVYRYGHEAKKFAERVLARPFTVVTRFQDARGRSRLPRYYSFVFPNGSRQDLGSMLTEAGLARSFGQTARNDLRLDRAHYDRLEAKARREGMGIFGGRKPQAAYATMQPAQEAPQAQARPVNSAPAVAPAPDLALSLIDALSSDLQIGNAALGGAASANSPRREAEAARHSGKINVNMASQSELERLPGVGRALSKRIIANRPYATIGDLSRVPRLGESVIERIAPLVEF